MDVLQIQSWRVSATHPRSQGKDQLESEICECPQKPGVCVVSGLLWFEDSQLGQDVKHGRAVFGFFAGLISGVTSRWNK